MHLFQEERLLTQLKLMGVFDKISGLLIGKPEILDKEGAPFDLNDLILEIVGRRNYPIVSGIDISHTCPMHTISQLSKVRITARLRFRYDIWKFLRQWSNKRINSAFHYFFTDNNIY